jgi:hypothetical protein
MATSEVLKAIEQAEKEALMDAQVCTNAGYLPWSSGVKGCLRRH